MCKKKCEGCNNKATKELKFGIKTTYSLCKNCYNSYQELQKVTRVIKSYDKLLDIIKK